MVTCGLKRFFSPINFILVLLHWEWVNRGIALYQCHWRIQVSPFNTKSLQKKTKFEDEVYECLFSHKSRWLDLNEGYRLDRLNRHSNGHQGDIPFVHSSRKIIHFFEGLFVLMLIDFCETPRQVRMFADFFVIAYASPVPKYILMQHVLVHTRSHFINDSTHNWKS